MLAEVVEGEGEESTSGVDGEVEGEGEESTSGEDGDRRGKKQKVEEDTGAHHLVVGDQYWTKHGDVIISEVYVVI